MANALLNPRRRRRKSRRRGRARRRRNPALSNPLIVSNRKRRARRRRSKGGRRRRRNMVQLFNPFGGRVGGILRRVTGRARSLLEPATLVKGAAATAGALAAMDLPNRLAWTAQRNYGWTGVALSAGAAAVAAAVVGLFAPNLAPAVFLGGLAATGMRALGEARVLGSNGAVAGMGDFLTVTGRNPYGQIPSSLIAGMGDFLETKQSYASLGPATAAAIAPSGVYSNAS